MSETATAAMAVVAGRPRRPQPRRGAPQTRRGHGLTRAGGDGQLVQRAGRGKRKHNYTCKQKKLHFNIFIIIRCCQHVYRNRNIHFGFKMYITHTIYFVNVIPF